MRAHGLGITGLGVLLLAGWLAAGCAPRVFVKTSENALRYPYIPVEPKELAGFQAQVKAAPKSPEAVSARFWIAQDSFNRGEWAAAEKAFLDLAKRYPRSEWAPASTLMAARSRVRLQKAVNALALIYPLAKNSSTAPEPVKAAAVELGQEIVNESLTVDELPAVRTGYPDTPWAGQSLFVLGKRTLDAGNPDQAMRLFKTFLDAYPASAFVAQARELIVQALRIVPINRNKIGLLVPQSGPLAPYGQAVRQGVELALSEINQTRAELDKLTLAVVDTAGTTAAAAAGLQRLAETDKVFAVLGPVTSPEVRALLPILDRWRLPLISPSAGDPDLAGRSPYFFRYVLTPEQQAQAVAEWVVLKTQAKRIGILASQERYDQTLAAAFAAKASVLGGDIVTQQSYPAGTTDFKAQMLAMGGVDPGIMKNLEVEERKTLERVLDGIAHAMAQQLAPRAMAMALTPEPAATPEPGKPVAILRFTEDGYLAQKEQMGKRLTERFSYILAAKPGLDVMTQRKTFDALHGAGLEPEFVPEDKLPAAARVLPVAAIVAGKVTQVLDATMPMPGAPVPVKYTLEIRLLNGTDGAEVRRFTESWTKTVPPEVNLKQLDAIYLPVTLEDAILIAPQLSFYDLDAKLYGPDAWVAPKLLREGADVLNGAVMATGFWPEDPDRRIQEFAHRYITAWSAPPSLLAAQAYDAARLLAGVLTRLPKQADREELSRWLRRERDADGVTGRAWAEENGDIRRRPWLLRLENGKLRRAE